MFMMAIHRISNHYRRHNLIPKRRNPNPNNWTNIITPHLSQPNRKQQQPRTHGCETWKRQPETTFGLGVMLATHEPVRTETADLFPEYGTNYETDELEPNLLGVEVEFWREDLGDLNCEKDGGKVEDYAVGDRWEEDIWVREQLERGEE
jgi:hypothetical protein